MLGDAPDAGAADLFRALRDSTADLHTELEDRLGLAAPDLSIDRYADAVGVLAAATLAVEAGLQRAFAADTALAERLDWPRRRKTDLVVGDLSGLGRRLPCCVEPLTVEGTAAVVGAMYVTEGSTLGGQVVDALVRRRLGDDVPRRSFRPYGTDTKPRWRAFQSAAGELVGTDQFELACAAARRTFQLFLDVADTAMARR